MCNCAPLIHTTIIIVITIIIGVVDIIPIPYVFMQYKWCLAIGLVYCFCWWCYVRILYAIYSKFNTKKLAKHSSIYIKWWFVHVYVCLLFDGAIAILVFIILYILCIRQCVAIVPKNTRSNNENTFMNMYVQRATKCCLQNSKTTQKKVHTYL